jgi:transcriptional regulator with XRE-family HTH domain
LFGKQVRKLRVERQLSQEKLAEKCGYHRNQIGRIERGEQPVSFDGVLQLSHGLAVRPAEIWRQIPIPKRLPPRKAKEKDQ